MHYSRQTDFGGLILMLLFVALILFVGLAAPHLFGSGSMDAWASDLHSSLGLDGVLDQVRDTLAGARTDAQADAQSFVRRQALNDL